MTVEQFKIFILILFIIFLFLSLVKKTVKFLVFAVIIVIFLQIGFYLSKSPLNDKLPLDKYFKYDIVEMIKEKIN